MNNTSVEDIIKDAITEIAASADKLPGVVIIHDLRDELPGAWVAKGSFDLADPDWPVWPIFPKLFNRFIQGYHSDWIRRFKEVLGFQVDFDRRVIVSDHGRMVRCPPSNT